MTTMLFRRVLLELNEHHQNASSSTLIPTPQSTQRHFEATLRQMYWYLQRVSRLPDADTRQCREVANSDRLAVAPAAQKACTGGMQRYDRITALHMLSRIPATQMLSSPMYGRNSDGNYTAARCCDDTRRLPPVLALRCTQQK